MGKERNKSCKKKIKSTIERVKNKKTIVKTELAMKKVKNPSIHERSKRIIACGKP